MIKVNLLTGAKREAVRRTPTVRTESSGGSQNILLIVVLALSVAFVGWRYYSLSAEGTRLDSDLETAHVQLKKVEDDRKAIEVLKEKKAAFQKQIDIITELKNNQAVPVRLLDEVSRNLPDFLWLTSMQEQGNQLSVMQELQADCFAGVWGHYAAQRKLIDTRDMEQGLRAAAAIGDDRLTKGRVTPDAFTHGTSQQRMTWFRRGLETGDVNQCDTFSAAR